MTILNLKAVSLLSFGQHIFLTWIHGEKQEARRRRVKEKRGAEKLIHTQNPVGEWESAWIKWTAGTFASHVMSWTQVSSFSPSTLLMYYVPLIASAAVLSPVIMIRSAFVSSQAAAPSSSPSRESTRTGSRSVRVDHETNIQIPPSMLMTDPWYRVFIWSWPHVPLLPLSTVYPREFRLKILDRCFGTHSLSLSLFCWYFVCCPDLSEKNACARDRNERWWIKWLGTDVFQFVDGGSCVFRIHDDSATDRVHDSMQRQLLIVSPPKRVYILCVCLSMFGDADKIDRKQLFSLTTTDSSRYQLLLETRYKVFIYFWSCFSSTLCSTITKPNACFVSVSLLFDERRGKTFLSSSSLRVMLCSSSPETIWSQLMRDMIAFSFHSLQKASSCHHHLHYCRCFCCCKVLRCCYSTCGWEMSVWLAT